MDTEDVSLALNALSSAHYHDSEWCQTSPHSPWIACDSYVINYRHVDNKRSYSGGIRLYLKFFLSGTGDVVMFVSFHESK